MVGWIRQRQLVAVLLTSGFFKEVMHKMLSLSFIRVEKMDCCWQRMAQHLTPHVVGVDAVDPTGAAA